MRSVSLAPAGLEQVAESESTRTDSPWSCTVWDDPVNLMSYVTFVFMTYFGYPRDKAERLMLTVHSEGRAAVSHGSREQAEKDVSAMHSYGLWATVTRDG
ncbi:MAG: ATP-dependent Clp protease adapter ClpS [Candidatus Nanopelagicales bacterium]|nr:ATP-dependent Clp protease adapter ClpS [Candidatus Nanopelagicales bacterium]